jgi:hypothetical protein
VLGVELGRSSGAYDVAFSRYESVMREYVNLCQALPPGGLEGMLPRTRRAIWLRNLSMRLMTRWPVWNLVSGMFRKVDAIELEDYFASSEVLDAGVEAAADALGVTPAPR